MKKIASRILIALSLCLAVPLSSCSSTGVNVNTNALARAAVQVAVIEQLSKAKTPAAWNARHAQITTLALVLEGVNTGGLSIETLRPLIAEQLKDEPYALILLDLVLANATPAGTGAINNATLAAIVDGMKSVLALPPPDFA